jgi:phosphoglycerate dehydrogenase-like enzyme
LYGRIAKGKRPPVKRAALFSSERYINYVYAKGRRERVASVVDLLPGVFDEKNLDTRLGELADVEVIFSTWGMPMVTPKQLDAMPKLRAIFYAAGTVKAFATPVLDRGIMLMSAWRMNAIPVAEMTLAQILLSTKSYFANSDQSTSRTARAAAPIGLGNFEQTVALLGAGAIGRKLIELLRPFVLDVIVFDPFLSDEDARLLGVRKVSLETAFAEAIVVSNHLANVPATVGMLRGAHFTSMQQGATFINTGRGAQVNEAEMIAVLRARPDLYALLDVTDPEPPVDGSPLWMMPNVKLSAHIAGSHGNEVVRMADLAIEDFLRWERSEPLQHQVTAGMLDRMA